MHFITPTYWTPLAFPLGLASAGELMPSALLNFGTAGVSNADLRLTDPLVERRCNGVSGTTPSSLIVY